MGDFKLYQQSSGSVRFHDVYNVIHRSIINSLDDIGREIVKMSEIKLLIYLVGIPAYVYAFFIDIASGVELWKGIILTAIGAFTGVVIGCRQLVRLMKEWREYKKEGVKK